MSDVIWKWFAQRAPTAYTSSVESNMSVLELTDQQVLSLVRQLPPEARKAALFALAQEAAGRRHERMAFAEDQLRQRARERGLDWDKLDDAQREDFVNRLLHEA
jgi:hypothetical protein